MSKISKICTLLANILHDFPVQSHQIFDFAGKTAVFNFFYRVSQCFWLLLHLKDWFECLYAEHKLPFSSISSKISISLPNLVPQKGKKW